MAEFVTTPETGSHWYLPDGTPFYTYRDRNDVERPVTLRQARNVKAVPSVTTVISAAARPGLENWKQEQLLLSALTLPRNPGESERDWLYRVMVDSRETAAKAAARGTAIHAAIEQAWAGWGPPESAEGEYAQHVLGASAAVQRWSDYGLTVCQPERSFAHPTLGYGGKVDLSNELYIVDFKTKEYTDQDPAPTVWPEHKLQLAAYRKGVNPDGNALPPHKLARCAVCFVSVTQPGLATVAEITEDDLENGWEQFAALLAFWRAQRRYYPGG